jgi:probable HAF family extracellular repeat protein
MSVRHRRSALLLSTILVAPLMAHADPRYSVTPIGVTGSHPTGINNIGDVVGYFNSAAGVRHAFLYTGNAFQDLGTLAGRAAAQAAPAAAASATNLYVSATLGSDSNPGTPTAPFRTIQRAANLARPGTTINVSRGIYSETIKSSISGTATARIRYVSVEKQKAIITRVGTGGNTMWTVSGGYIDIDGFALDGTGGTTTRVGIALTGGNSSVQNTLVHDVALNSGCDDQGGAGMVTHQYNGAAHSNYDFIGNVVHHVGGGCGRIQGIYHSSSGRIINNVVYATSQGINLGHDDHNILVMNNTVFNNAGYGVRLGGCTESYNNGCPTSGIQIHNNIIYDNYGGIQGPIATEDKGNSVSNNLVYANGIDYSLASTGSANQTKTGMIAADPQFVNYIANGGGDYRLKSTSPAIGKGQTANAPAYDINGKARGAKIDMGAYEY